MFYIGGAELDNLFPDYIILILIRSPMYIRGKQRLLPCLINVPTKRRMASHQIDGVFDVQIDQGLSKIVHGLVGLADGNE